MGFIFFFGIIPFFKTYIFETALWCFSFAFVKGEVSMASGNLVSGLPKHHQSDINLYLFPNMENKKDSQGLSWRERERDEQI